MFKCFERSTVGRIEESPAVYLYDTHIIRPWQNEPDKRLINRKKRHYTRMAVLLFLISPWKRKEKRKKKKKLLQQGVFVFGHPSMYCLHRTGLIEQRKHVAVLVVY